MASTFPRARLAMTIFSAGPGSGGRHAPGTAEARIHRVVPGAGHQRPSP